MPDILSQFKTIRHFIFDIDGVLTDGNLLISADGTLLRSMNIKDGYALQLAIKKGYSITIISGANGEAIQKRLLGLGLDDIHLGVSDKLEKFHEVTISNNLNLTHTLYMGDDMPDLEVMKKVALPCCPSDACTEIKSVSIFISPFTGGKGCVRDVIEKVLKLNQHWE
ncbi:MAG: 3-deoxy-D-manno-octulosonate 8-phosphate phosphatase [Bacteroidetes bacterium]|nr:3-deoxy-D-manno-octulosonate 8-phosphate phosphatase [Bacteroidota bacterium]